MRRITRYVVSQFLKVFVAALAIMTCFIVLAVMGQEAIRHGLSPVNVMRLLPYAMPIALLYAVPGTSLFAACSVYGRMSANNEVLAIKSLGVSPMSLIWPNLALAFVLSVGVVWLNDVAVSWGRLGTQRVILDSVEQIAYGMLRTHHSYASKRFSINVKGVDGERLIRPSVTLHLSDQQPPAVIAAEEAVLQCDPENNRLRIFLTNGDVTYGKNRQFVFPDTQVIHVPLWAASRKGDEGDRPSDTALRQIPQKRKELQEVIRHIERSLATEAAYQMLTGDFDGLKDPEWDVRYANLEQAQSQLHRLNTEPWRRWANGFSCLVFVMVGAPLAIQLRNSDVWTSFAACFLPTLVVYYPLLAYGVKFAKSGEWPPFSVWLGNVVFLAVGWWLMRIMMRR